MYRRHLKRTRQHYFSPRKLHLRLAFWGYTMMIGVTAALFAQLSHLSDEQFQRLYPEYSLIAWALPPFSLVLIAWLTRHFFRLFSKSDLISSITQLKLRS